VLRRLLSVLALAGVIGLVSVAVARESARPVRLEKSAAAVERQAQTVPPASGELPAGVASSAESTGAGSTVNQTVSLAVKGGDLFVR
jgi:hypothetical protein